MSDSLAELLAQATEKPELRDEFFKRFLTADIYVPVNSSIPEGAAVFETKGEAPFTWAVAQIKGAPTIPVFTSQDIIEDFFKQVNGWEGRFIISKGVELLANMAPSEFLTLEINPASEHGLRLSSDSIKNILKAYPPQKP